MKKTWRHHRARGIPMAAHLFASATLVGLLCTYAAQAETVYRCGPDLKQYSQQPCDGGHALEVDDHRNAEQMRQGQEAARHHAKAERDVEQDLKELERRPPAYGSLSPRATPSAANTGKEKPAKSRQKNVPAATLSKERISRP